MRKTTICKVAVIALLGFALHGCKKPSNGIDNNQVITKPYSLFVADTNGVIYSTNDGQHFRDLDFTADGSLVRAIATSGNNLIMIKNNSWVRVGTDINFNQLDPTHFVNPAVANQSMVLDVPALKRVYIAGSSGTGVEYSDTNGKPGTWHLDTDPHLTSLVTSFTLLDDGTVIAYSDASRTIFTVNSISTAWTAAVTTAPLPATGNFFITHLQNTIVAADYTGSNGVWYSKDKGITWAQYPGVAMPGPILSMTSAFGQVLLIGTRGGIYRLTYGNPVFTTANTGLGSGVYVTGLTTKDNYFKNGEIKQYVYASTNLGIYRSEDLGLNWVQIVAMSLPATNFVAIY